LPDAFVFRLGGDLMLGSHTHD
jgi:hypothetical protein